MSLKNKMLPSQIHKRINFNFDKQKLVFDTSQELFSFAKVDDGTKELLNSLRKNSDLDYKNILDLGCGYGAIGIFLKNKFSQAKVLCTDRDSLAVEFTIHNAELNEVKIDAIPSLDFQGIKDKFSLIITNFPAKLEKAGLEHFIAKSSEHLEKNGTLAIVIVKELENTIKEILKNENITISYKEKNKNYSVYHLKLDKILSFNHLEPYYLDNEVDFNADGLIYLLHTSNSLQEFDSPHFITELIMDKLLRQSLRNKTVAILNPGQGFIPLASIHQGYPEKITLASRDLLQVVISSKNLDMNAFNHFETINSDFPQNKGDLLIWSLRDESTKEILEKLLVFRKNFKKIILGGRIQIINRITQALKIEPKKEIRGKYCVVEI